MILPDLPKFPTRDYLVSLPQRDVVLCLDTLSNLVELYLQLNEQDFRICTEKGSHIHPFVISSIHELAEIKVTGIPHIATPHTFQRHVLLLLYRSSLTGALHSKEILRWPFISDLCLLFPQDPILEKVLRKDGLLIDALDDAAIAAKSAMVSQLSAGKMRGETARQLSIRILCFLRHVQEARRPFLIGSDLIDTVAASYKNLDPDHKPLIIVIMYFGLRSLLDGGSESHPLLCDLLFDLKSMSESQTSNSDSYRMLLTDLVCKTPFARQLTKLAENGSAMRFKALLEFMNTLGQSSFRSTYVRSLKTMPQSTDPESADAIRRFKELLPDIPAQQAIEYLSQSNGDLGRAVEQALDRSVMVDHVDQQPSTKKHLDMGTDHGNLQTNRRGNVFDNDDFDKLAVSARNLHLGKRDTSKADAESFKAITASSKSAILAALASFDSNDDERDDTYDLEDVGGTVDNASPEVEPDSERIADSRALEQDRALFSVFTASPEKFERTAARRRSPSRRLLKERTGMTDEAIEGWAVMLQKQPRRAQTLAAQSQDLAGNLQPALQRSSWRGSAEELNEGSGTDSDSHRAGQASSRGRGRGPVPQSDSTSSRGSTKLGHQRKEAHKSSRANHNRRDQRARKIARGGFAG